ncbi:hypothetical protein HDR60_02990 [bacterium]|nr:hypothetical protein [bacterium]
MRLVGLNDFTVKDNGSVSINVKGSVINADIGEYIVKDENNEYYTCDVDTFEKAYVRFVGIGGAL